ncbi:mannosyl-oligosaccharide alpha-1,2-mannosidase [Coniosporium apollinis]|uniref:Mannosyl-oligosaccharide alpha-1,2-mannosidase n=1 Tax=Coniosporium apollinis TaxID=61459 RepID=A0ABQ9NQU3_9PEZI|nr:mannosyl-oligosaccharide alpha-1,2-mannosidase [Coniosporium apollinis]
MANASANLVYTPTFPPQRPCGCGAESLSLIMDFRRRKDGGAATGGNGGDNGTPAAATTETPAVTPVTPKMPKTPKKPKTPKNPWKRKAEDKTEGAKPKTAHKTGASSATAQDLAAKDAGDTSGLIMLVNRQLYDEFVMELPTYKDKPFYPKSRRSNMLRKRLLGPLLSVAATLMYYMGFFTSSNPSMLTQWACRTLTGSEA